MRRLPVYFLVDVSDSMVGEPIEAVKKGLSSFFDAIQSDPYALEVAVINLIVFAGQTKKLISMQEAYKCYLPDISIGSGTCFGQALETLMNDIDANVNYGSALSKGDWKPLVFFITDGTPTDFCEDAIKRWNTGYQRRTIPVALAVGNATDMNILSQLTETVLKIDDVGDVNSIKNFFKCVSASVQVASVSVDGKGKGFIVSDQVQKEGLEVVQETEKTAFNSVDQNYVILRGRCQTTKKDYLLKYQSLFNGFFQYEGSYGIDGGQYEALSDGATESVNVDTSHLVGCTACPHCENELGLVQCGACRKIFCSPCEGVVTCPWCGNTNRLVEVENLSVERTNG